MADAKSKPTRLWRVVLVCSLALNLAIAGVIGGAIVSGRFGDGPQRSFDLGLGPVVRALAPDERRAILRDLQQDRVLRGLDFRAHAGRVVASLTTEPFDPDVLRQVLAGQAAQVEQVHDSARDAFVAMISQMTPQRRAAFAQQLADELSRARTRAPSGG